MRSAARAAIVMPAVFAFADKVIADPQVATFAAFGSFAMLVLVEFDGPMRSRLFAYVALACAGVGNIALGTFCSRNAYLAAGAMAVVGFAILISGVINGYFAAAGTAAMLTFILSATLFAPMSEIPHRLEGWGLASAAGIAAQMLLWPRRPTRSLRKDVARAVRALADLADATLARDPQAVADRTHDAGAALATVRGDFLATPHRTTIPAGEQAALVSLADEVDWLLAVLAPPERPPGIDVCRAENAAALAAAGDALRASADLLEGGDAHPDVARLEETRRALVRALAGRLPELPTVPDDQALVDAVEPAFRIRVLSYGAGEIAADSLAATRETSVPMRTALEATEQVTVEHASARSVAFRNAVRGAAGLAVAVYIAQRSGVQHSFWIVLGTLSVLRSNALGTGWSILSALAGTAVGIVIGSAVVIGIGTHEAVLWAALPPAVFLASYAPRAISFAAGQAGFTVTLIILFNIIQPVGWRVGLVRIEDVAIGFAVSLGVGLLFWPRGAGALLRENLAAAYARGADYVAAAERVLVDGHAQGSAGAAQAAAVADHRLDDAFRAYLTERSARPANMERVAAVVAGPARLRRTAQSLASLAEMSHGEPKLAACGANLDGEVQAVRSWYVTLGDALAHSTAVPPPHARDTEGRRRLLECVHDAVAGRDKTKVGPALELLWASQHLDVLWQLEGHLARNAADVNGRR